ncbi:hypothetical protein BDW71DRAFT_199816 [Aspergillus fruticulosus]
MIVQSLLLLALSSPAMGSALIADPSNTADLAADSEGCYNGRLQHRQRRPYCEDANDTSVLVATPRATSLASTRPSIANSSTAHIENSNITVHDGAANIFAYGTGTTVCVRNTGLRSSGPASHGLYAAGNGTIYASNIRHYSGSNLCSSYSGDTPARYVYVRNAVAHTAGAGSAIFYALGETAVFKKVDFTAGLLVGTVMFPSAERQSGASDMASLWFGDVIATTHLVATEINPASGILVIANSSHVTQAFDHFADAVDDMSTEPVEVTISVAESTLEVDLAAANGSFISWNLTNFANAAPSRRGIRSRGFNIYYNGSTLKL